MREVLILGLAMDAALLIGFVAGYTAGFFIHGPEVIGIGYLAALCSAPIAGIVADEYLHS